MLVRVAEGSDLSVESPLELRELDDEWFVTGDLRLAPGLEDDANNEAQEWLHDTHGIVSDPETSCFYSDYSDHRTAKDVHDLLLGWWELRLRAAYATHPEWFAPADVHDVPSVIQ